MPQSNMMLRPPGNVHTISATSAKAFRRNCTYGDDDAAPAYILTSAKRGNFNVHRSIGPAEGRIGTDSTPLAPSQHFFARCPL
jgi:hypothetical protein